MRDSGCGTRLPMTGRLRPTVRSAGLYLATHFCDVDEGKVIRGILRRHSVKLLERVSFTSHERASGQIARREAAGQGVRWGSSGIPNALADGYRRTARHDSRSRHSSSSNCRGTHKFAK